MATTTIRLEEDLKARVAAAAERQGQTAHAYILDAIAHTVEQAELSEDFHVAAQQRWTALLESGKSVAWDDAKTYVRARALGRPVKKPAVRKVGA